MKQKTAIILARTTGITYTPNGVASGPDGPFRIPTVQVDGWDATQWDPRGPFWGDWYFTLWSHAGRDEVSITLRDHAEPDAGYQIADIPAADVPAFFQNVIRCHYEPDVLIQRADAVEASR